MAAVGGLAPETRQEPATRPTRPGRGAMDWSDVRVFLAVAREGSMRAAGRALGLSQPTIARRLAAFEVSRARPARTLMRPAFCRRRAHAESVE
jgi:hypothetical protein